MHLVISSKKHEILQQNNTVLVFSLRSLGSSDFIFSFLDFPNMFRVFVFRMYLLVSTAIPVVRGKGHVLMFHGGGCTPFTQVNDTHLHARLAALLIQLENEWSLSERERFESLGLNKTPTMTREEIVSIVQTAWVLLDHERVAEKGYKQTGPTMPLTGPISPEDVFADLLRVMETIEESTPTEVGMTLRDEAVAFVKDGHAKKKWVAWADCHKLIEEHDGLEEAVLEGMEAFGVEVDDATEESEAEAVEDAESEDCDDPGGHFDGLSAKGPDELEHDVPEGEDVHDDAPAADLGAEESKHSLDIAAARQLLFDDAIRTKDDKMLKIMRTAMREQTREQTEASTEVGSHLRKRAHEQMALDAKRRKEAAAEERLAAMNLEEVKVRTAKEQRATQDARCVALNLAIQMRRDTEKRKRAEALERAQQRWLQTTYPVVLARHCINSFSKFSPLGKKAFEKHIQNLIDQRTFARQVFIGDLWISDKTLNMPWATTPSCIGGVQLRQVRCGLPFQEFLGNHVPPRSKPRGDAALLGPDPVDTLFRLFSAFLPLARQVFQGAYTPLRLLHVNDYVLDKAFVYGIVALSKWIREEHFPSGVYGHWPPRFPADLLPIPIQVDIPDDLDEENLTPMLRPCPASSSTTPH